MLTKFFGGTGFNDEKKIGNTGGSKAVHDVDGYRHKKPELVGGGCGNNRNH